MEFITLFGTPKKKEPTVFEKIKDAVKQTKENFTDQIQDLIEGEKEINPQMLDHLEAILIGADIGVVTTNEILKNIKDRMSRKMLQDPKELRGAIKEELRKILNVNYTPSKEIPEGNPFVVLIVGVNGVGKTTTIAKLAYQLKHQGKEVLLAAADTFRAAAIEQLQEWADRVGVEVIKHGAGADPAAVVYDSIQAAKARRVDVLIIDTAGRLHTKVNLMEECKKIKRVVAREHNGAPHEILLVLDATVGQNGIAQAKQFHQALGLTGLVITKLDGTAKGGIVVSIVNELTIPVKLIGVGEKLPDLQPFDPTTFTEALFDD